MATAAKKFSRDDSHAGGLLFFEAGDLFFRGEEADVRSGFRAEREVVEPKLAVSNRDEAALELDVVVTDEADFWSGQTHAAGQFITERVVKVSAAIDSDSSGLLFLFHITIIHL